jgi:hypothetical protein
MSSKLHYTTHAAGRGVRLHGTRSLPLATATACGRRVGTATTRAEDVSCERCRAKIEKTTLADEALRAGVIDGDGNIRVSARAMHAMYTARRFGELVAEALVELNEATTREAYVAALGKLANEAHGCNALAARALEYTRLDGEGEP